MPQPEGLSCVDSSRCYPSREQTYVFSLGIIPRVPEIRLSQGAESMSPGGRTIYTLMHRH